MARVSPEKKMNVKKRLLDEAANQFAAKGLDATNINEIALSAGFAKGTIYNYFTSKEELFGEVIIEAARKAVERYSQVKQSGSARASLRALALADLSVLREEESFMKVLIGEALRPMSERYPLVLSQLWPFIETTSKILESGVMRNEIRSDTPVPQLSLVFVGMLALLYVQYWNSGGAWPILDDIPDLVVTFFMDGAAKKTLENVEER